MSRTPAADVRWLLTQAEAATRPDEAEGWLADAAQLAATIRHRPTRSRIAAEYSDVAARIRQETE